MKKTANLDGNKLLMVVWSSNWLLVVGLKLVMYLTNDFMLLNYLWKLILELINNSSS